MCENTTINIQMYRKYTNPVTTNIDKIHFYNIAIFQ